MTVPLFQDLGPDLCAGDYRGFPDHEHEPVSPCRRGDIPQAHKVGLVWKWYVFCSVWGSRIMSRSPKRRVLPLHARSDSWSVQLCHGVYHREAFSQGATGSLTDECRGPFSVLYIPVIDQEPVVPVIGKDRPDQPVPQMIPGLQHHL